MIESLAAFAIVIGLVLVTALVLSGFLLWLAYRQLKAMRVPQGADFATTLRHVPLVLVVGLDLLDFALDFFAVPIVWIVLSRFGLERLRDVATIEALIPFTQPLPLLTVSWIAVRLFGLPRIKEISR